MAKDALYLTHLPFSNIIEENEQHVLILCLRYHEYRLDLEEQTKSLLLRNEDHHELYKWEHVHLGRSVRRIFSTLFKKKGNVSKAWENSGNFQIYYKALLRVYFYFQKI